ncbi:M28 family peptidase [Neobacillus niacini]|uniref:M28 family peptidase n=1 Tax=Neobacillus niacini TaxID=86668 RepID=UPI002FFEA515
MKKEYIRLIQKLSDPSLNGRVPGTKGHDVARRLISEEFEKLSLTPLVEKKWEQTYTAFDGKMGRNLLARRKGHGEKWLLLGAHYDHIKGCPGANDNAAAIGILLSVLDSLKSSNLNINIVLAIFDMEDHRYFLTKSMGSIRFYRESQKLLNYDHFLGAFILDLCGHSVGVKDRENSLFVIGANTSQILSKSIEIKQNHMRNLQIYRLRSRKLFHLSDNYIFEINRKPNLFFTCGHDPNCHTPKDTFEKLNLEKISIISTYITHCILTIDRKFGDSTAEFLLPSAENSPFDHESETAELSRFFKVELGPHHNLDLICDVLMKELSKTPNNDLESIKTTLKALKIL